MNPQHGRAAKTILIIRNAYSFDFGGGERFPVSLAKALSKHDFSPVIVSRSPKLLQLAKGKKVRTHKAWWWQQQNFSGPRVALFPLYCLWQLLLTGWYVSLIVRYRADIVHAQSRDDFIAASIAGRLLAKQVVWTDHADLKYIWQNHRVWYKNPVGKLVYMASKLADHITLVSMSEKDSIEHQLGHSLPAKFVIVYNGVTPPAVSPITRQPSDNDASVFVATSRLVRAKGIGELLEAFLDIDHKHNVRLWVLGEGNDEQIFREQAAGNPHVSFLGFPDNYLSYVAAADIFVHPSYHEGFSISIVEAASLGKPVIACAVGGNPEIVHDSSNGLLVPPQDSKALATAMEQLATNPQLRVRYGQAALETFQENFVFERIVKEHFLPLYET